MSIVFETPCSGILLEKSVTILNLFEPATHSIPPWRAVRNHICHVSHYRLSASKKSAADVSQNHRKTIDGHSVGCCFPSNANEMSELTMLNAVTLDLDFVCGMLFHE